MSALVIAAAGVAIAAAVAGLYVAGYRAGLREADSRPNGLAFDDGRSHGFEEGYRLGEVSGYARGFDKGLLAAVHDAMEMLHREARRDA